MKTDKRWNKVYEPLTIEQELVKHSIKYTDGIIQFLDGAGQIYTERMSPNDFQKIVRMPSSFWQHILIHQTWKEW